MYPTTVINVTAGDSTVSDMLAGQVIKIIEDKGNNITWDSGVTVNLGPEFTEYSRDSSGLSVRVKSASTLGFKCIERSDISAANSWTNALGVDAEVYELNGNETLVFGDNATKTAYSATLSTDMTIRRLNRDSAGHGAVTLDLGGHTLKSERGIAASRTLIITNGTLEVVRVGTSQVCWGGAIRVGQDGAFVCTNGNAQFILADNGAIFLTERNGIMNLGGSASYAYGSGPLVLSAFDDSRITFSAMPHIGIGASFLARDRSVIDFSSTYFDAGDILFNAGGGTIILRGINYAAGVGASWKTNTVDITGATAKFDVKTSFTTLCPWKFNITVPATGFATAPVTIDGNGTFNLGAIDVSYTRDLTDRNVTIPLITVAEGKTFSIDTSKVTLTKSRPQDGSSLRWDTTGLYLDVKNDRGTKMLFM